MFYLGFIRSWLLADSKRLGRWGERRALRFLKKKGLCFVARNYRHSHGEIDLIMADTGRCDGSIVFVEVKTRRNEDFALGQDAVTAKKRAVLARTARNFIRTYNIKDKHLRFDVVVVVLGDKGAEQIRHYENVFTP